MTIVVLYHGRTSRTKYAPTFRASKSLTWRWAGSRARMSWRRWGWSRPGNSLKPRVLEFLPHAQVSGNGWSIDEVGDRLMQLSSKAREAPLRPRDCNPFASVTSHTPRRHFRLTIVERTDSKASADLWSSFKKVWREGGSNRRPDYPGGMFGCQP